MTKQFVDPAVSKRKFEREVAEYKGLEKEYRARGWFLVDATFPQILVVMSAPHLQPPAIVTGVAFDYSNYDAEPPSVRLVNPFTGTPFLLRELPTNLPRLVRSGNAVPAMIGGFPGGIMMQGVEQLMQGYGPDDIPFLCIAGVREYHNHPAHTGDNWQLHRIKGEGRLAHLLGVIHTYGIQSIASYAVTLMTQVSGFVPKIVQ